MKIKGFWSCFFLFSLSLPLCSQPSSEGLRKADSLQRAYDFESAEAEYRILEGKCKDSIEAGLMREKEIQCENGKTFLQYAGNPTVIAVKTVHKKDFFLYYSHLGDRTWMSTPNSFVKEAEAPVVAASYLPEGAMRYIFSAPDESGSWNLNVTVYGADSLWSTPQLMNEDNTSPGNEILPLMSPDGKYLYFSSNGLFGMGGYDLYRCAWDEENQDWGVPENLGFPYSSPADDYLFSDTPDGKLSVFASNRDCSPDSLRIYVIAYQVMPVKRSLSDLDEIRRIARLEPSQQAGTMPSANASDSTSQATAPGIGQTASPQDTASSNSSNRLRKEYFAALSELRSKTESASRLAEAQKKDRENYLTLPEGDSTKSSLEQKLLEDENKLMNIQQELSSRREKIQEMEMEFLTKGMTVNPEEAAPEKPATTVATSSSEVSGTYTFTKMSLADLHPFRIRQKKEKTFDYSFKIDEVARFAPSDSMPNGIVYQIHIFNAPSNYPVKTLKGLSPVFKRKLPNGKCDYSVGIFRSYDEVLQHLNQVKKVGFNDAYITAYEDGGTIAVARARKKEAASPSQDSYKVVLSGYGEGMPAEVRTLILSNSKRDITKSVQDGATVYIVGPFGSKFSADSLAASLTAAGIDQIAVEQLK